MRSRMIIGLAPLAALSFALAGCAGSPSATPSATPASEPVAAADTSTPTGLVKDDQVTMLVTGLSCPFCATNLERGFTKLPGVEDVAIDLGTGQAKVLLIGKERPTYGQLQQAVKDSGFTFVGFADPGTEAQP